MNIKVLAAVAQQILIFALKDPAVTILHWKCQPILQAHAIPTKGKHGHARLHGNKNYLLLNISIMTITCCAENINTFLETQLTPLADKQVVITAVPRP